MFETEEYCNMNREYFVIDAFTTSAYEGNPAAVVLRADGLTDKQMLSIAADFNLSETTFITKVDSDSPDEDTAPLRFRWFTPTTEVDMCGHATLAGVHALLESGQLPAPTLSASVRLPIETRSGRIIAHVESLPDAPDRHAIWLDLIDPIVKDLTIPGQDLVQCLGVTLDDIEKHLPPAVSQDRDAIVFVNDFSVLNDIKPDFKQLSAFLNKFDLRGLSVATIATVTPSINVQSRFFAPTCGIDEAPVTGSVHGPLGAYLVERGVIPVQDNLVGLQCTQGIPGGRTGLVWVLVQRQEGGTMAARIGGQAVTSKRGALLNCE